MTEGSYRAVEHAICRITVIEHTFKEKDEDNERASQCELHGEYA